MPIYEYACDKCGQEFEELVSGGEAPECPFCGASETHKLMSCCAHTAGGGASEGDYSPAPASSGGGCHGCSGGNCAGCGGH